MIRVLIESVGASSRVASTVATAATELAQNIVSHAPAGGEVAAWIDGGVAVVRATNWGAHPLGERRRGARGLGHGQASVQRLMDRVEFGTTADGSLVVTAYLRLVGLRPSACL